MITTIAAIQYPYVITNCKKRIGITDIIGNVVPGATIELVNDGWKVKGVGDPNCET